MRSRILTIPAFVIALAAVAALASWPSLSIAAKEALERRLQAETGQPWRVGSLGLTLDPAPSLVLEDVTVGNAGDGIRASLRRVRIAIPVAVLFGGAGTVDAAVADAAVRLPLAPHPGASGPGQGEPGPLRPSAIRATARGVQVRQADAAEALDLTAATLDLALDLAREAKAPAIGLDIEAGGTNAHLEADPPGAGAARPVRLTLNVADGPRIAATATAGFAPAALTLDAIAGSIDRAPFSGRLAVERADRPRLVLDLRLDALALRAEGAPPIRDAGERTLSVPVRADLIPDPAWFRRFEAQANLSVGRLALGPVQLAGVAVTAQVRGGSLDAALTSAGLYGGSARGRYVLGPDGAGRGRHQLGLSLTGIRVLPLLSDWANVRGLDGAGTVRVDLQATGAEPGDLLRSAVGQGEVTVTDGRIDGLDLARAAGLLGGAGGGLATRLDRLGATFSLAEGQALTNDLRLKTGLIDTEGVGTADLIGRRLDLRLKPLTVVPGGGGRLDVPIRVSGSWDDPAVSADLSGLARDPMGAIQGLQGLGEGLRGTEGGLGGLLDALLPPRSGPPRRQRP